MSTNNHCNYSPQEADWQGWLRKKSISKNTAQDFCKTVNLLRCCEIRKADTDRTGFQGSGTFMGHGRTVQARPNGNSCVREPRGQFLAVPAIGGQGENACLQSASGVILPDRKASQFLMKHPQQSVLTLPHRSQAAPLQIPNPCQQTRNPRYIVRSGLHPIRQIIRHFHGSGQTPRPTL